MLTDVNANTSKYVDKFYCENCNFRCSKKGDYTRHLTTRKHLKLTTGNSNANSNAISNANSNVNSNANSNVNSNANSNANSNVNSNVNVCVADKLTCACGTTFSHRSSLSRHKGKCNIHNTIEPKKADVPAAYSVDVVALCVKLTEDNQALTKKVIELAEKPNVVNHTKNVKNVFNLNVFLNENCKDALNLTDFVKNLKLQLEDLENMGKLGYVDGMSNIIIKGLEELDVEKRPIHCTDTRRDVLYIKENDTWDKDSSVNTKKISSAMEDIKKMNVKQMQEWVEKYPAAKTGGSQKCDEYHQIVSNLFGCSDPEKNTKKIIKNLAKHTSLKDAKDIKT